MREKFICSAISKKVFIILVSAISAHFFCYAYAADNNRNGVERIKPDIVSNSRESEDIASKIRQKTREREVIVEVDKITGAPHNIIGGGLELSSQDKAGMKEAINTLTNKTIDKKQRLKGEPLNLQQNKIDKAARGFITKNKDILLTEEGDLKLTRIQKVRNKAYVTYQQYYNGIPVYQAIVKLIINREGKIPSLGSNYHKDINIPTTPAITESQAMDIAKQDAQFKQQKDKAISDGLLILPLTEGNTYTYNLAYKLTVSKDNPEPACWVYFIDAHTGEILVKYNDIRHETISGKVTGLILPEYHDETPQRVNFKDEYLNIKTPAVQSATDENGNYSLTLNSGTYTLTTSLEGPYVKIINDSAASASYSKSVFVPSTHNIDWNTSGEVVADIAEMSCFYHVNKMHNYVKNTLKYDGMDFQMPTTVNVENYANAYYSSLPEMAFGDGGGKYRNFALFSDVIYHEYAHGTTHSIYDPLYSGESGAIDEGLADYFACTINGDSMIGDGGLYLDDTQYMRNLDNALKYPNNIEGEVHKDGRIIGGAFWDLRANLITDYGEENGRTLADDLIHSARFGYPMNFPEYYLHILLVDDDDDSIFNGTPHSNQIMAAFQKHNISLPDCYCSIESPTNKSYVRNQVSVIGIACSINPVDFKSYNLYCWKEDTEEKVFADEYLLNSSTVSVSQTGLLGIWDTTEVDSYANPKFKDDRYCLGVRIIKQNGEERVFYAHDIVVDNENSIPEIEDLAETGAFLGEEVRFNIEFELFDEPDGPYGGDLFSASNLPPDAIFDSKIKLFTWIPAESDMGKTYEPIFSISDSQYTVSRGIKMHAVEAEKMGIYGYAKSVSQYNEKIVWIEKHGGGVEAVVMYDTSTRVKSILDNGNAKAEKDNIKIYGNNVVWDECCAGEYYVAYYNASNGIKRTDISTKLTYPPTADIHGDIIVWKGKSTFKYGSEIYMHKISTGETTQISAKLSYLADKSNPAIYENKIVWQDMRHGYYNIYMFDVSTGEEKRLTSIKYHQTEPVIYENKIAWLDKRDLHFNSNTYNIYVYDMSISEERKITEKPLEIKGMSICKDKIVVRGYKKETDEWGDWLFFYNLYVYDVSTGKKIQLVNEKEHITEPFLYEKQIVWGENISELLGKWLRIVTLPVDFMDSTPPTGTIKINNGATYTTSTYVALSFTASDTDSQVTEMQITNDPAVGWAGPWPFAQTRNWTLPWGNGTKTVYARFKDAAGNWSAAVSDTIILDTSLPTTPVVTDGGTYTTSTTQLQVGWSNCSDPESYIVAGRYAIGTTSGGTDVKGWTQFMPPAPSNPFTIGGLSLVQGKLYYISLKFQNGAGLWSNSGCSDGIKVENSQTPWKNNANGTLYTNVYWQSYTMGYRFTPLRNGKIIKLGGYFNGAKTVYLWDSNRNLIRSATVNSANNWSYAYITPVDVVAGQTYTVGVYLPGPSRTGSYRYNCVLPKKYGDVTIKSSGFYYGGIGCPTTNYTYVMYGQVDIGFEPY